MKNAVVGTWNALGSVGKLILVLFVGYLLAKIAFKN